MRLINKRRSLCAAMGVAALFFVLTGCYNYKDIQKRMVATEDELISPADGKVYRIRENNFCSKEGFVVKDGKKCLSIAEMEGLVDSDATLITVFLNFYNKHIVMSPADGKIILNKYTKGSFRPAYIEDAQFENEHNTIVIDGKVRVGVVLVAGIAFRRITSAVKESEYVNKGDKLGHIKFGSAVILAIPKECEVKVKEGERVKVGETIIAKCR